MARSVTSPATPVSLNIAIVRARFNEAETDALLTGAIERLKFHGVSDKQITLIEVPGAIEIPVTLQALLKKKHYDAMIALGAVIRGETTHYDYVCEQVSQGCQQVALMYETPIIFGILTTENSEQAWDRLGGTHGHKGHDAADAAVEMAAVLQKLD